MGLLPVRAARAADTQSAPVAFLADRVAAAAGDRPPVYTIGDVTRIVLRTPQSIVLVPEPGRIERAPIGADGTITLTPPTPAALAGRRAMVYVGAARHLVSRMVTFPDQAGAPITLTYSGFPPVKEPAVVVAFVNLPPPERVETPELVLPEDARLRLAITDADAAEGLASASARFRLLARGPSNRTVLLLDRTLDPEHRPAERGWLDLDDVPLDQVRRELGARVQFVFEGAALPGTDRPALPLWADPVVVAPRQARPPWNVLLVSIDTLRASRLGTYGGWRETSPALDRLASEGALFETAIAAAPWTLPSHATMLTGLYPCVHGLVRFLPGSPLPQKIIPLAEHLRHLGWETAAFTEDGFVDPAAINRGFGYYRQNGSKDPDRVRDTFGWAAEWLRRVPTRPFFAFVHTYQPHSPYWSPETIQRRFANPPGLAVPLEPSSALAIDRGLAKYDAAIRYTDDALAGLLAALDASGLGTHTLVVVTSDHGEAFGEHGFTDHGPTLYEEVLRVPLVFRAPGLVAAGRRVGGLASLADVVPTVLDLLGVAPPHTLQGVSLADLVRADREPAWPAPRLLYSETSYPPPPSAGSRQLIGPYRLALRAETWKVVFTPGGTVAYDLERDPGELQPAGAPDAILAQARTAREHFEAECERLRTELAVGAPAAAPAVPLDPATKERLRALGYVE